ncbi:MAG: hypothetical protein IT318_08475 [Anaerolineales bacterium]|nr:hypothetical protein [Anaerolineales bacterium]
MRDMLDWQIRLREATQLECSVLRRALVEVAEATCVSQWDAEKRAGRNPEQWPGEQIGAFVIRHARAEQRRAWLMERPDLPDESERLLKERAADREEIDRLKLQLEHFQASTRTLAERVAQLTAGKKGTKSKQDAAGSADIPDQSESRLEGEDESAAPLEPVPPERIDALVKLIASTGISRSDDIREQLAAQWCISRASGRVGYTVRVAAHQGLLEAYPCTVEWPGEKTRQVLALSVAGRIRAEQLGVAPVTSEYETGLKHHKTPEHLYVVLKAADILRAEGYTDVNQFPDCVRVDDGDYCPDITARKNGHLVYIECERSQNKAREVKWSRAGQVNGGTIFLVTPNRKLMDSITSEIKATTGSTFKISAFNISEYLGKARGQDGSIWLHQR